MGDILVPYPGEELKYKLGNCPWEEMICRNELEKKYTSSSALIRDFFIPWLEYKEQCIDSNFLETYKYETQDTLYVVPFEYKKELFELIKKYVPYKYCMDSLYFSGKKEWEQDQTKDITIRIFWKDRSWEDLISHSNGKFERVPGHYSVYRIFEDKKYKAMVKQDVMGMTTCYNMTIHVIELLKKRIL